MSHVSVSWEAKTSTIYPAFILSDTILWENRKMVWIEFWAVFDSWIGRPTPTVCTDDFVHGFLHLLPHRQPRTLFQHTRNTLLWIRHRPGRLWSYKATGMLRNTAWRVKAQLTYVPKTLYIEQKILGLSHQDSLPWLDQWAYLKPQHRPPHRKLRSPPPPSTVCVAEEEEEDEFEEESSPGFAKDQHTKCPFTETTSSLSNNEKIESLRSQTTQL